MKFKKKTPIDRAAHQAISGHLKEASRRINSNQNASALSALDTLVASVNPERKCQIASLAAQAQFQQGKFAIFRASFLNSHDN